MELIMRLFKEQQGRWRIAHSFDRSRAARVQVEGGFEYLYLHPRTGSSLGLLTCSKLTRERKEGSSGTLPPHEVALSSLNTFTAS